ncbi:MAG: DUF86 domain-containing protein [Chlamydiia bacterium]|nr:DUF86 domain-containing protein [Chlamydiia bacterium]
MVDKDIIYQKINRIQNCLKRIYDTLQDDPERLNDYDIQDIVTLNLQRAIQLTIDLAAHMVRSESYGMPKSLKENFQLLHQHHWIDNDLKVKMEHMVGFRNIAVHDYESINPEILKSIFKHHLKDIEAFYTTLVEKIDSGA